MDVRSMNEALAAGGVDRAGLFPHLDLLAEAAVVFEFDFGLDELPIEPGLLSIRGARQFGKSTWLEQQLRRSVVAFGAASAFYLNGDDIRDAHELGERLLDLTRSFRRDAAVRRIFVDEITAVPEWERAVKRLADRGDLRRVLVVTTGSRATDLRRGTERLPGRKGRLQRTEYLFLPISYREFTARCGETLGDDAPHAYLISGGAPIACREILSRGVVPEWVIAMVRDWIHGECAAARRDRAALLGVLEQIQAHGGSPLSQARLARDAGLANNTVAAGYIELLADLLCAAPCHAWDAGRRLRVRRRPHKLPFINLLAAVAFHRNRIRSPAGFRELPPAEQGAWLEWLVGQELFRRASRRGDEQPELLRYWVGGDREIDYVTDHDGLVEVKRGRASPLDFAWFPGVFPGERLTVITRTPFETDAVRGVPLDEWLREG